MAVSKAKAISRTKLDCTPERQSLRRGDFNDSTAKPKQPGFSNHDTTVDVSFALDECFSKCCSIHAQNTFFEG